MTCGPVPTQIIHADDALPLTGNDVTESGG